MLVVLSPRSQESDVRRGSTRTDAYVKKPFSPQSVARLCQLLDSGG